MKEQVLNYKELNPNLTYKDLVKIFGLPLKELFKVMDITNYKIDWSGSIIIRDDNGKQIYWEGTNNHWYKWVYDANGKLIYSEDSYGKILKY